VHAKADSFPSPEDGWLAERARTNRIFVAVPMFLVAAQG